MTLNLVDALLVMVVLLGAWVGWLRGFLSSALELLTLAISLAAGLLGCEQLARPLERSTPTLGVLAAPLSFVVTFFLVHFLLGLGAVSIARVVPPAAHRQIANRVFGVVPGVANGGIYAVVAAVLLLTLPLGPLSVWARDSRLAERLAGPADWVEVFNAGPQGQVARLNPRN